MKNNSYEIPILLHGVFGVVGVALAHHRTCGALISLAYGDFPWEEFLGTLWVRSGISGYFLGALDCTRVHLGFMCV